VLSEEGTLMSQPCLRVFFGSDDSDDQTVIASSVEPPPKMMVSLGEILPALTDAMNNHRAWLNDFAEDPVVITADLYEVLLAYQELRPTA
jgi:hypothetical protein